jgi:PAS domain S-box-containing protein
LKDTSKPILDSNAWLEDLFDEAHDLIQIVQLDGSLLYVNKMWSKLLGYSKEEIQGQSLFTFIAEEDRTRYQKYRNQIISGAVIDAPIVFNLQAKSGHTISVEGIVNVKLADGKPIYTRGIFRDITLRLQNEEQLRLLNQELHEREQNMEQLLLNAPDAVIVIDQNSRIIFWNPKAETLFGWKAEEVMNQSLSSTIVPHQHREAHDKGMQRFLATGVAHVLNKTIEITALNKDGHEFYIALTISATQQRDKTAFIAFIRDITKQKHNQLELERKTKQLEQSNASLEDFAHAASHDLKEPLRKICIFTDRLKNSLATRLDEGDAGMLERVEISAKRMQLLVDDLLEFSHVSEQPRAMEAIDLNEKVKKVLADLELSIEEKSAKIIYTDLPIVWGHRRQLQQLLYNLISNALKYSKPGIASLIHINSRLIKGAEAAISIPSEYSEQTFYLIEVKDNGIGFEQEFSEQIFEMFKRLHGKTEYIGTGVGLAIVRKVVENHNGYIWAESQPNEGATFNVMLPVEQFITTYPG